VGAGTVFRLTLTPGHAPISLCGVNLCTLVYQNLPDSNCCNSALVRFWMESGKMCTKVANADWSNFVGKMEHFICRQCYV